MIDLWLGAFLWPGDGLLSFLFACSILSLLEALVSLRQGLRFHRFFARVAGRPSEKPVGRVLLIVPCRGLDPGLRENLRGFFEQDYPDYRLIFVVDHGGDLSVDVIRRLQEQYPSRRSALVVAGEACDRGQKVHNLLHALQYRLPQDRMLAFGDSDIRPERDWLRSLLAGLDQGGLAASTGFRWYLPPSSHLASVLRAVWNAGAVSLLDEDDSLFAWGGAMALSSETLDRIQLLQAWEGALSDDYALSAALKSCGGRIRFRPRALSPSYEDCGWRQLFEWTLRQMTITRIHKPGLWKAALAAQTVNALGLWGGMAGLIWTVSWGLPGRPLLWAVCLIGIYGLGALKAFLRLRAVSRLFPRWRHRHAWALVTWGPLASLLTLVALLRSVGRREIAWRGVTYRMLAPDRTQVLRRSPTVGSTFSR